MASPLPCASPRASTSSSSEANRPAASMCVCVLQPVRSRAPRCAVLAAPAWLSAWRPPGVGKGGGCEGNARTRVAAHRAQAHGCGARRPPSPALAAAAAVPVPAAAAAATNRLMIVRAERARTRAHTAIPARVPATRPEPLSARSRQSPSATRRQEPSCTAGNARSSRFPRHGRFRSLACGSRGAAAWPLRLGRAAVRVARPGGPGSSRRNAPHHFQPEREAHGRELLHGRHCLARGD